MAHFEFECQIFGASQGFESFVHDRCHIFDGHFCVVTQFRCISITGVLQREKQTSQLIGRLIELLQQLDSQGGILVRTLEQKFQLALDSSQGSG